MTDEFTVDELQVHVLPDALAMGASAAQAALETIRSTLEHQDTCRVVFASANSQLPFFSALRALPVPWERLEVLHMDEYVGLASDHPASFVGFLRRHLLGERRPRAFHAIDGRARSVLEECCRYDRLLSAAQVDLCCLGIGENGHLAFNEPGQADFLDPVSLKVVRLDEVSRAQQVGEGHFPDLGAVPHHAITLTVPALLAAHRVIGIVPDERKADAVAATLQGPIAEAVPASALRRTPHARLFLDRPAASGL